MSLVSILVAAHRARATIGAAVASVVAQTHEDWELIVVSDDGEDYRRHLPGALLADRRLRFAGSGGIGLGPSAARNAGLALARGEWVAALDADDRFAPERLAALLARAAGAGLAADGVAVVDEGGALLRHAFPPGSPDRDVGADEIMACGVPLHPLARRELVGDGWPPLRFAEDVVFNLRLLDRAGRYPVAMRPLYVYVVHPGSICHGPDAAANADRGYQAILDGLERDGFGLSAPARREALEGFAAKRRNNLAFAAAQAQGFAGSFQEFMAARGAPAP